MPRSVLLRFVINQLRSDYMPFCDQYTMPAKETLYFLMGHPGRLLSLDDLVDTRLANFRSFLEHRYIHRLRSQLNALPPDEPDRGIWLLRLADFLSRRFWQLKQKDDLEEAIWYYEEALTLLPQTHYHFLEAILGFCSCVYQRFHLLGHLDDLKKLLEHLHTEQNLDLEALLTSVKAQLQPQPTKKLYELELLSSMKGEHVPKGSSNLDADTKWAKENPRRQIMGILPDPSPLVDLEPEVPKVRRLKNATSKNFPGPLDFKVPIQNMNLDMKDEANQDEA